MAFTSTLNRLGQQASQSWFFFFGFGLSRQENPNRRHLDVAHSQIRIMLVLTRAHRKHSNLAFHTTIASSESCLPVWINVQNTLHQAHRIRTRDCPRLKPLNWSKVFCNESSFSQGQCCSQLFSRSVFLSSHHSFRAIKSIQRRFPMCISSVPALFRGCLSVKTFLSNLGMVNRNCFV